MIHKIELRSSKFLRELIHAAFPSYKKRNVFVSEFHEGISLNSYWQGGSRDEFAVVFLPTMSPKHLPTATHPYFDIASQGVIGSNQDISIDSKGNIALLRLPKDFALVRAGVFCGKPATAHIFLSMENYGLQLEDGK